MIDNPLTLDICSFSGNTDELDDEKLHQTLATLNEILHHFLAERKLALDKITITDGFYFIMDKYPFDRWKEINWWDQSDIMREIKKDTAYKERTTILLQHSEHSRYFTYSVETVLDSDNLAEQYANRRERLFLKEGFENAVDSVSHAAYFKNKFIDLYPGLLEIIMKDDEGREVIILIDNGTGHVFYKPYRRIKVWRILYKIYKAFRSSGAYYIGGMHLGLQVTFGSLKCFQNGAVVSQVPLEKIW